MSKQTQSKLEDENGRLRLLLERIQHDDIALELGMEDAKSEIAQLQVRIAKLEESLRYIRDTIETLPSGVDEEAEPEGGNNAEDLAAWTGGLVWREARRALGEEP